MATIEGLTKARLLQLEADTVIGGHISGDDLILEQHDGSTINAGSVRGFPGIDDMTLYDPVGVPKPFMLTALPSGYGLCDAQTEYDADTYPVLAAEFGTGISCINGVSTAGKFRLPDLRGKTLFGLNPSVAPFNALHNTGGSKDAAVINHVHPHDHAGTTDANGDPHVHEFDHTHGAEAGVGTGDQIAMIDVTANVAAGVDYQAITGYTGGTTGPSPDAITGAASDSSHTHSFTTDSDSTNPTGGVSATNQNLPPYRVVKWIMRLA